MKKISYLLFLALLAISFACSDDDKEESYITYQVDVQLVYQESDLEPVEGVKVTLYDTSEKIYEAMSNNEGKASFTVPAGVYRAVATDHRKSGGFESLYNGEANNIAVTNTWDKSKVVELSLTGSTKGQVIIKELYVGGCQKDDGSGNYQHDKYVILYNNSDQAVALDNLCLGIVLPYNAQATNNDYENGKLSYEDKGWIPAGNGIWYYPTTLNIEPGKEIVIALSNAIDNTKTYSHSINFSNPTYYCTYDIEAYNNTTYYSVPDAVIPTAHYWSAVRYGQGNAWTISNASPAFFIFRTEGVSPVEFANDPSRTNYHGGKESASEIRKTVPVEWILDGIEVFTTKSDKNQKRLTKKVDVGQTYLTNQYGYTSYRNVDAEATKAIEGNESKLVYNYALGTEVNGQPSTDPSGIDAEASIRNGARIIYMDTNNSTKDFHQRKQASLRN